ncbi:MAG: hypothetical protein ACXWZ2_19275, partial [Mycobacterium sp.]
GSPRGEGELSEEHAVLGAEIVDRGDHEGRDLVGGQIGAVPANLVTPLQVNMWTPDVDSFRLFPGRHQSRTAPLMDP